MAKPSIDDLLTKEPRALTPQMSGDLLAEIKRLAKERYLQLEIGTHAEFEKLWREAFFIDESHDNSAYLAPSVKKLGENVAVQLAKNGMH